MVAQPIPSCKQSKKLDKIFLPSLLFFKQYRAAILYSKPTLFIFSGHLKAVSYFRFFRPSS
jgi:hypothetical protein